MHSFDISTLWLISVRKGFPEQQVVFTYCVRLVRFLCLNRPKSCGVLLVCAVGSFLNPAKE